MSKEHKNSTCMNCGEDLGCYISDPYDRSCGKRECDREARHAYQGDLEDRAERAREDGYGRY